MYLLFCTDFYIFRNFVFFVFLVVQYRRSVIYKIKRLDTNTRDFGYSILTKKITKRNNITIIIMMMMMMMMTMIIVITKKKQQQQNNFSNMNSIDEVNYLPRPFHFIEISVFG